MKKTYVFCLALVIIISGCSWFKNNTTTNPPPTTPITTTTPPSAFTDERLALCNVPPTPREIGDEQYPIAKKYEKLPHLGQIFTAAPCGDKRLNEAFKEAYQGYGEGVVQGSRIILSKNPSLSLLSAFKYVGYSCTENLAESQCKEWQIQKAINVNALLELEPYTDFFESDDCVNCG